MHPIDYLVLGLLALLVVLAVRYAVRHRGRCCLLYTSPSPRD